MGSQATPNVYKRKKVTPSQPQHRPIQKEIQPVSQEQRIQKQQKAAYKRPQKESTGRYDKTQKVKPKAPQVHQQIEQLEEEIQESHQQQHQQQHQEQHQEQQQIEQHHIEQQIEQAEEAGQTQEMNGEQLEGEDENEGDDGAPQPLLFVDVNLGPGRAERIVVYEGDTAEALAQEFTDKHSKVS